MSLVSTSSANQSDAVVFPYNRWSKESLFTGLAAHPSRALLLLLWGERNSPQAGDEFTLPTLPWEHKKKLQLYSMKNFFITMWNLYTKDELRDVYDTATGHRQLLVMLPVGFFPIITADRFFLAGAASAAPVRDKIKTMVGSDWAHTCRFMISSLIFWEVLVSLLPKPNLPPPGGLRQAACCWVTKEDSGSEKFSWIPTTAPHD